MLRVITNRQAHGYRLDLHGVLGDEWVPLLEQHWRSIMRALPSAKVTLVLSNVDFIDSAGERLLQRMVDDGVEFVVAGALNRYVIDNLKTGARPAKGVRR
jgi:anti-anti-sigma regulatory factor